MVKTYKIPDDSGFMSLVNVDKYDSFVKKNWEFNELLERFREEMNHGNLLLWSTGGEGLWNVRVTTDREEPKPFRLVKGKINVTGQKLFLINYEDLSMAAQFPDVKLPLKHSSKQDFSIENGVYNVSINQMFDPSAGFAGSDGMVHFDIVIEVAADDSAGANKFDRIPWL